MKMNLLLFLSAQFMIVLFWSCTGERKEIKDQMRAATTVRYKAIAEKDTAWFEIDTAGQKLIGLLSFHYHGGKRYLGQFKGEMRGDTLDGYFDFKTRSNGNWHRNPVSFLKRHTDLTMGVGSFIIVNWGSAYFDDKIPIDYAKGRFVFHLEGCR